MNNDYDSWERNFKDNLENPPPMLPDEGALLDMVGRLDKESDPKRRRGILWWWLLPLALTASTIYFFTQYQLLKKQTNKDTNFTLSTEPLPTNENKTLTEIVHHYDTIYQQVEVIRYVDRQRKANAATPLSYQWLDLQQKRDLLEALQSAPQPYSTTASSTSTAATAAANTLWSSPNRPFAFPQTNLLNQQASISPPQLGVTSSNVLLEKLAFLPSIPPSLLTSNTPLLENELRPMQDYRDRINPMWYFVPTGFNLGLEIAPELANGLPGEFAAAWQFGASAELAFRQHLRLGIGLRIQQQRFEVKTDFESYPVAPPEVSTDVLNELYIDIQSLELPVYLRYQWRPDKQFRPFVQVDLLARRALTQGFEAEYVDINGEEYKLSSDAPSSALSVSSGRMGLGVDYWWRSHWAIRSQIWYQHQWRLPEGEFLQSKGLGLDLGLRYRF